MKRTFAAVLLLAALGALAKLAVKAPATTRAGAAGRVAAPPVGRSVDPEAAIQARYPGDRALVDRTLARYRQNALAIEQTDGIRGLALLDKLDIEAVFLYEKYPEDFRRLRDCLSDDAAADLVLHWRDYFGAKRSDESGRSILIREVAGLTPTQRTWAGRYPNALPLILSEPEGMTDLIRRLADAPDDLRDALTILDFLSLSDGATSLRAALRALDAHGQLALDAFRLRGPEGFAQVALDGPVLEALGDALPLDDALIVLRTNADAVADLRRSRGDEGVAALLRHAASAGLVEAVGGSPHGLRLLADYGDSGGDRALDRAGADAADVVYEEYADPALRAQAVRALADHGSMALAMLAKYATDPDFREILRQHGPPIIPPIAQADAGPETLALLRSKSDKGAAERLAQGILYLSGDSGQATIRLIKSDGLERVASLQSTDAEFAQFLPLYDLAHLGNIARRGQSPTAGELTWAAIDAGFVAFDVLSLVALQPEGAAASELARSEVKAAGKSVARSVGREAVEGAGQVAARSGLRRAAESSSLVASRWWAVRAAGGPVRVLRSIPEALPRLGLAPLTDLARPISARAGLTLSAWAPVRLFEGGVRRVLSIPPGRGIKYVSAQALQATVGLVAFGKMDEHLHSRMPEDGDGR